MHDHTTQDLVSFRHSMGGSCSNSSSFSSPFASAVTSWVGAELGADVGAELGADVGAELGATVLCAASVVVTVGAVEGVAVVDDAFPTTGSSILWGSSACLFSPLPWPGTAAAACEPL